MPSLCLPLKLEKGNKITHLILAYMLLHVVLNRISVKSNMFNLEHFKAFFPIIRQRHGKAVPNIIKVFLVSIFRAIYVFNNVF